MKKEVVFSTRNHKPNELAYFKAGRYIGMMYPEAGGCSIMEDTDEDGYCLKIFFNLEGGIPNA